MIKLYQNGLVKKLPSMIVQAHAWLGQLQYCKLSYEYITPWVF